MYDIYVKWDIWDNIKKRFSLNKETIYYIQTKVRAKYHVILVVYLYMYMYMH